MKIEYIDMGDVSSQDNKDYLIVSTINKIIENQNNIGKIIDDKIIYHTRHIDDDITEIEQKYHDLNIKINEIIENQIMLSQQVEKLTKPIEDLEDTDADARCQCEKAEPPFAPNNDDSTFILMKTDQLKHIINTLTFLTDEMNTMIKRR